MYIKKGKRLMNTSAKRMLLISHMGSSQPFSLIQINFSEIVDNNCIAVVQIDRYGPVEVAYISHSNQSRGDFLQNQMHSRSKCLLKKFQYRRPQTA